MTVFHAGEIAAQHRAGFTMGDAPIRPYLTEQHRSFFAALPALFVGVADAQGWPVATVMTGAPGFLSTPDEARLAVRASLGAGDPAAIGLRAGAPIGLLGIDPETRRRNRLNGSLETVTSAGFVVSVRQSFGNCPKYIQARHPMTGPAGEDVAEALGRLDDAAQASITAADTFFIASTDGGQGGAQGGLDMSHRGGRPGFVQIEGDVLTIPDFRGNRYFNTLGNLLLDGRAGLLFVDWLTGSTLHLQGRAEIVWDGAMPTDGPPAERLWRLHVTAVVRRRNALPLRWEFGDYAAQLRGKS